MNTLGRLFRVTIFGASHGPCVGVLIDGVVPGIPLSAHDFQGALERRRGSHKGTTARQEPDLLHIDSGLFEGHTTGEPLVLRLENRDVRSEVYDKIRYTPRPGHADLVSHWRSGGWNDYRGGGANSGRMTAALVLAGVVAGKLLYPAKVSATIDEIGGHADYSERLAQAVSRGDSLGGMISCTVNGLPPALGEPWFDSVESLLAHALFSIPGVKGVEFGSGFAAALMSGQQFNDLYDSSDGRTLTNNAGGVNGGLTNGNPLTMRIAVRPPASIAIPQPTFDLRTGEWSTVTIEGRHDACFALRMPVVVEAAVALVLADLLLLEKCGRAPLNKTI